MDISNSITTVSTDSGNSGTATASVGISTDTPTTVPTGFGNDILQDSFLIPFVLTFIAALMGAWIVRDILRKRREALNN